MRKANKLILSFLLVAVMIMQMATVGLAAKSTTKVGSITYTYDAETNKYTASVHARGLEDQAKLIIAEYDKTTNEVVASNVSVTAANAKDALLKVTLEATDVENEVKAFLWDNELAPFTADSTYTSEFTEDDVQLYIAGVKFEDAFGEAMAFGGEYDFTIPAVNGDFNLPDVTYVLKNSAMDVDIKTDYENMQTVVIFEGGRRFEEENIVVNAGSTDAKKYKAVRYEYSKPWTESITINWTVSTEGYITNDLVAARGTTVNGLSGGDVAVKYDYVMEYNIPDDKAFDTISFKANKMTSQFSIIIVEALEKETKGYDAIVNTDGSAIQWTTDTGVIAGYNYTLTGNDRVNEPWDEARATYGEYTNSASVVITGNTTANGTTTTTFVGGPNGQYRVSRKMQEYDGYFVNGSRISEGSRHPVDQKIQYIEAPDNVLGYNYITNSGTDNMHNLTVTMTVNQDVKIHFISNSNAQTISKVNADGTETGVTATDLGNDDYRRYYQNTAVYDAFSAAYQVVNNGVDESIFRQTNAKQNYTATVDGVKYTYPNAVYVVRNWKQAFNMIGNANRGYYILPEHLEEVGLTPTGTDTEKTVPQKSISEYVAMWRNVGNAIPFVSTPEIITGHVYNGSNVSYVAALRPIIREFNGADTNKSIFSDRNGAAQQRHTGMIHSYPEAYDLEDSVFITTAVKYGDGGEGDRTMYRMYGNVDKVADYKPYPLYTFKVSKESEVLIFTNGYTHMYLDDPANGWDVLSLNNGNDGLRYVHVSNEVAADAAPNASIITLYKIYRKVFNAGDTVTMYTPGDTLTVVVPFVKPITTATVPGIADILVDGESIGNLDPLTREFTYDINDASATTLPEVEFVPDADSAVKEVTYSKVFNNAYAKAVIVDAKGAEAIYTLKFVNTAVKVTDLYLCTEGNVIPAEYIDGATADVVANDLPKYEQNAFALGMPIWADRDYVVTDIKDESLVGMDVIKSCVLWWNSNTNPEHKAFLNNAANGVYIPWVNFKTNRAATAMVFKTTTRNEPVFEDYGFEKETMGSGYFTIERNGGNKNVSTVKFAKDIAAGELVTVPNDNESSNSYTILIKYADYE